MEGVLGSITGLLMVVTYVQIEIIWLKVLLLCLEAIASLTILMLL